MSRTIIVARKEIKEIIKNRTTLLMGLAFAVFFSLMYSLNVAKAEDGTSLDGAIFYLSLSIAIFMAYVSTGQIFLMEKRGGVIETLICAPVSLRQIWFGKTIAGVVPAWLVSLFATLLLMIMSGIQMGTVPLPGLAAVIHVLVAVPIFIAAFIGLVGFGQLLLGMRQNALLNFLLFVPAFGALYGSGFAVARGLTISWPYVSILLGGSLILLGIAAYLTRYLSRERIVTTIA
ncbi:MAG: ABC transporter permease [Dehalococcoidales bacterium]|nr:ABC transporter permease [Dehalococcoidales bacterium]